VYNCERFFRASSFQGEGTRRQLTVLVGFGRDYLNYNVTETVGLGEKSK